MKASAYSARGQGLGLKPPAHAHGPRRHPLWRGRPCSPRVYIDAGSSRSIVKCLILESNLDSRDFNKIKEITWLATVKENMVPAELMAFCSYYHQRQARAFGCARGMRHAYNPVHSSNLAEGAAMQCERKTHCRLDVLYYGHDMLSMVFRLGYLLVIDEWRFL